MPPEIGAVMPLHTGAGKRLRLFAVPDVSPKTLDGVHAVYAFESLADREGGSIDLADAAGMAAVPSSIKGIVARIHYARHGQPNGVVLESGEFIHLRPHGMAALDLIPGAKISARGELRMTILGTRLLEAHHANGYDIE